MKFERLTEMMKYDNLILCLTSGQAMLNAERWHHLAGNSPAKVSVSKLTNCTRFQNEPIMCWKCYPAHGTGFKWKHVCKQEKTEKKFWRTACCLESPRHFFSLFLNKDRASLWLIYSPSGFRLDWKQKSDYMKCCDVCLRVCAGECDSSKQQHLVFALFKKKHFLSLF